MISWILSAISVIRALISLYRTYLDFMREQARKRELEREENLQESIDRAKKAKTPDEAWDAQTGIVDNSN